MTAVRVAAALLLVLMTAPSYACGHCVEDKIAAVYDHAGISKAFDNGNLVAFFAVDGELPADEKNRKSIRQAVRSIDGVDKGSVRISLEQAALSVAFDPRRLTYQELERKLGNRLSAARLKAVPMKLMVRPAGASRHH